MKVQIRYSVSYVPLQNCDKVSPAIEAGKRESMGVWAHCQNAAIAQAKRDAKKYFGITATDLRID